MQEHRLLDREWKYNDQAGILFRRVPFAATLVSCPDLKKRWRAQRTFIQAFYSHHAGTLTSNGGKMKRIKKLNTTKPTVFLARLAAHANTHALGKEKGKTGTFPRVMFWLSISEAILVSMHFSSLPA